MKYSTKTKKSTRARAILLGVLALVTVIHAAVVLEKAEAARNRWEPDCEYPLANANISWLQTYYGGTEQ